MRSGYEFSFHTLADASGHGDATLGMLGSMGWEIRGIAPAPGGGLVVALQRPQASSAALPDAPTLAATLDEPLVAPDSSELSDV